MCANAVKQSIRFADSSSRRPLHVTDYGQVHLPHNRACTSIYIKSVVRSAPSRLSELRHDVSASPSSLRSTFSPIYNHSEPGTIGAEVQKFRYSTHHLRQQSIEANHFLDGHPFCLRRFCVGKHLSLELHASPVRSPDAAILPERSGGWIAIRVS